MKSIPIRFAVLIALASVLSQAQDSHFSPNDQQIPVPGCLSAAKDLWIAGVRPCTESDHESWLADIRHWRDERRIRTGYDGSRYERPELQWAQSSFIQPQMMVQDRYFFNPIAGKYTVDRYLDDLEKRYGGIDSVLIWPTYPNMGIDNRNQHDLIHSMPGGIAGVRQMIADFHRRGVRVLFPMMMWDQGTRQPDRSWPDEIASLMAEIGADGINASPWPFRWLQTRLGTRSSSNRRMVHPMKRSPGT
jgi:iron(II)-dependent oxidoreductase